MAKESSGRLRGSQHRPPSGPGATPVVAAAHAYVSRGLAVLPIPSRSKGPTLHGWPDLRLSHDQLGEHFKGAANIGLILGAASGGLVDVDLDCPEAIELAPKFLPPTTVVTGRPSAQRSHWWYRSPGAVTRQLRDEQTDEMIVELRSDGAQTVVGPSVHPSGEAYEVLEGEPSTVDATTLSEAVQALHAEVMRLRYGESVSTDAGSTSGARSAPTTTEQQLRRARAYLAKMPAAISGQKGHSRTYAAAAALVHGFCLDPDFVLRILIEDFNPRCEPPWTEKELRHKVSDAATKPHKQPKGWLLEQAQPSGRQQGKRGRACTDLGNAERFAAYFGDRLRYMHVRGRWLVWDGRRWKHDDEGAPLRYAGLTARRILQEAAKARLREERKSLTKWAAVSENRTRLDAMVHIATSQPELVAFPEELDSDPWLLNVLNGTVDLRTGQLRPHRREDLITHLAPVEYDPNAPCPLFARFVEQIFDRDRELIGFVRRLLGYCLSGDITEQILPIFHGEG